MGLSIQMMGFHLMIPMDDAQKNHLKAYGIAYWILERGGETEWLLNYRGGSFIFPFNKEIQDECAIRGVSTELISSAQYASIMGEINRDDVNMDMVKLQKAPKIAVYSPTNKQPWDDAVTLVLTYAEIPYDLVYDDEVLQGWLPRYDWIHLHHEDFTGQYGKFWARYKDAPWYREEVRVSEEMAKKHGYTKVSQLKLAVALKIRDFVAGGGYLFAMCSAPDSYDVALAAEGIDICESMFDGDPMTANAQSKLDYSKCFAFTDFQISTNPYEYEISTIDIEPATRGTQRDNDYFSLFDFSAKWDPIPSILCQNHTKIIEGFMGQTTAFRRENVKKEILIMGENTNPKEVRYIHGEFGKGMWTFLSGHDPEDYEHMVGDPPTELNLHPNSAGYRLILNNILFPAAKKKNPKT
jgi:hypothetical protein